MSRPLLRCVIPTAFLTIGLLAAVPTPGAVAADPLLGAPPVGECYDVPGKTAYDEPTAGADPVACSSEHTLWVVGVGQVPKGVPMKSGNSRFDKHASKVCDPAVKRALGDRGLRYSRSAYNAFRFVPSKEQQAEGARWVSCVVGLMNAGGTLVRNKVAKPLKVTGKFPSSLQICGNARYSYTTCATKHVYRSTHAFYVEGKATDRRYYAAAQKVCPRHVSSKQFMYGRRVVYPTRFIVVCFTKTSR